MQTIHMPCVAQGDPTPTVAWRRVSCHGYCYPTATRIKRLRHEQHLGAVSTAELNCAVVSQVRAFFFIHRHFVINGVVVQSTKSGVKNGGRVPEVGRAQSSCLLFSCFFFTIKR